MIYLKGNKYIFLLIVVIKKVPFCLFEALARENKEVPQNERKENKGERRVSHREVYTQYCRYKPRM
jgi:hypothetical protein